MSRALQTLLCGMLLILLACGVASCHRPEKRSFNISAGLAAQTLKEFARQADAEIVYKSPGVGAVRTQAVTGTMPPVNALEVMLAGTTLVFERELETGAYAVTTQRAVSTVWSAK